MRKAALVTIAVGLACLSLQGIAVQAQEAGGFGGVQSFGFSSSFSNDSSHILIGEAEDRRVWTLGAEYTRLLRMGPRFRLDYEGSIDPLYEETDPTDIGTSFVFQGQTFTTPQAPVRVVNVAHGPVGSISTGVGASSPIYVLFGKEDTYAASIAPIGARVTAFPRRRIRPIFGLDLGFVVSARDIPVDQSAQFNYMFSFGPGVELFADSKTSWRFEYIYRHVSNAGAGAQNPGVDQGVVRVTLSVHR